MKKYLLNKLWNGEESLVSVEIGIEVTNDYLVFSWIDCEKYFSGMGNAGEFIEGLWEGDVVELFIREKKSDGYFEFNLSADGAWWGCYFSSPRIREESYIINQKEFNISKNKTSINLKIPLSIFKEESLTFNITAIIEKNFLSLEKLPGEKADFHQPAYFNLIIKSKHRKISKSN